MYSSLKRPTCKCGCGKLPTIGCAGYSFGCMPPEIAEKVGDKKKLQQKRANARKYASVKLRAKKYKDDNEQEFWFRARRLEMIGICACGCKQKTCKDDDKKYKFSIAHVLRKSIFKSVAKHPDNWIELAAFGDSCHTTFDNMGYDHCKNTKPKLWELVVVKFKIIYPSISEEERKHIPKILLDELENL